MQTAPKQAFGHARPVLAPRQTPRPFVLTPELLEDAPPPVQHPGAWLEAAVSADVRIMTPSGPRSAGTLAAGDAVLTVDHGSLALLWVGRRSVSAGQILARPDIAPLLIPSGTFGGGAPRSAIRLSPRAGVLVHSRHAPPQGMLARAEDLSGHRDIGPAPVRPVTYVQLLLERHSVIVADGLAVESFHPACLGYDRWDIPLRAEVLAAMPELEHDTGLYGPQVRPRAMRVR